MKIAKAYCTVSNAALCVLTGLTPITIKIEEASQYYHIIRSGEKEDTKVETKIGTQSWQHPAETITLLPETTKDTSTIQLFTDGSMSEKGVGAGIAIYKIGDFIKSLKYKLNIKCTNNQAEELAILKALQYRVNIHAAVKTATVYTDSRITLNSLKKQRHTRSYLRKIKATVDGDERKAMAHPILLGESLRRRTRKRDSRHVGKGGGGEYGHTGMLR
jgi:ribonuclease HI